MRRWIVSLFIAGYVGALLVGLGSHLLRYGVGAHPAMYFVVWDMFQSWSALESRTHVIGEGISGAYYELAPGPWGEFRPHGHIDRRHFDSNGFYTLRLADCTLRHTEHEPMLRIYQIEENWSRRFNLSEQLQTQLVGYAEQPTSYFHLRQVWTADGTLQSTQSDWFKTLHYKHVVSNPRLQRQTPSSRQSEFPLISQRRSTGVHE